MKKLLVISIICFVLLSFIPLKNVLSKGQEADKAREGEDALDKLLRRFGKDGEGLAKKIYIAIDKGVAWLLTQQKSDGHYELYNTSGQGKMFYPMGGTALPALAIKKSMMGLYEGDEKDLRREVKKLEKEDKKGKLDGYGKKRLEDLKKNGADEIKKRMKCQHSVDKSIEWLRAKYKVLIQQNGKVQFGAGVLNIDGRRTYGIGVTLMLLEAYYTKKIEKKKKTEVDVDKKHIKPADLDWIREMVNWLADQQKAANTTRNPQSNHKDGAWRYPGPAQDGSLVDNSNTQYAVLGLKAASRMGVHIKNPKVWEQVCEYYIRTQDPKGPKVKRNPPAQDPKTGKYHFPESYRKDPGFDYARGWGYLPKRDQHHPSTSAMTTSGLAALITAKSELYTAKILPKNKKLEEKIDKSINDGIAWLTHYFTVEGNIDKQKRGFGWDYYYLYGLERVGVLAQLEFFGKHPWYILGAKLLVSSQSRDGRWAAGNTPGDANNLADTAFALLFLKRATTPVQVPLKVPRPEITGKAKR